MLLMRVHRYVSLVKRELMISRGGIVCGVSVHVHINGKQHLHVRSSSSSIVLPT
jgi:hypothetical protein